MGCCLFSKQKTQEINNMPTVQCNNGQQKEEKAENFAKANQKGTIQPQTLLVIDYMLSSKLCSKQGKEKSEKFYELYKNQKGIIDSIEYEKIKQYFFQTLTPQKLTKAEQRFKEQFQANSNGTYTFADREHLKVFMVHNL